LLPHAPGLSHSVLLLLACCYIPAFVIVAALKPGIAAMIPIIIGA
jgi:hypothetical protein